MTGIRNTWHGSAATAEPQPPPEPTKYRPSTPLTGPSGRLAAVKGGGNDTTPQPPLRSAEPGAQLHATAQRLRRDDPFPTAPEALTNRTQHSPPPCRPAPSRHHHLHDEHTHGRAHPRTPDGSSALSTHATAHTDLARGDTHTRTRHALLRRRTPILR